MDNKNFVENRLKCIIFDMDGLLVDTEKLRFLAYKHSFKQFNIIFKEEDYSKFWVRLGSGLNGYYNEKDISVVDKKQLSEIKKKFFLRLLNKVNLQCFEGVLDLLKELKNKKIKIALATSSSREEATYILKKIKVYHYFDFIATKNDVQIPKPNVEIYKFILYSLNITSKECISIDDSLKGIIPSKLLDIKAIAIPNKYTIDEDFTKADLVLDNMKKLDLNTLLKVLNK
jgi:beta-phosphoglucomutase